MGDSRLNVSRNTKEGIIGRAGKTTIAKRDREKAKQISTDANAVPDDRVDEYNALLEKAKEFQQKAIDLRNAAAATPS